MTIAEQITRAKTDYDEVYAAGQTKGFDNGFNEGEVTGYSNGYMEGIQKGETVGYGKGYDAGYEEGIVVGGDYSAGKQAEREAFWNAIWEQARTDDGKYYLRNAFGSSWSVNSFNPVYPNEKIVISTGQSAREIFKNFNRNSSFDNEPIDLTEFCSHVDFSQCTGAISCFENARVINVTADFGNCTNLTSLFNCGDGGHIDNVNIRVTEACTNYLSSFAYARKLTTIRFTDDSVIAANIGFPHSTLLTHDSLISVITALKDFSGTDTTCTLTLHANAKERLSESEIAIATQKGWTVV